MSVDLSIFEGQNYASTNGSGANLRLIEKCGLSEIYTCGLGRTRFVYGLAGGVSPITVYFEDGGSLQRQSRSASWSLLKTVLACRGTVKCA